MKGGKLCAYSVELLNVALLLNNGSSPSAQLEFCSPNKCECTLKKEEVQAGKQHLVLTIASEDVSGGWNSGSPLLSPCEPVKLYFIWRKCKSK